MPVVGIGDLDNYRPSGDYSFLSLPNDKDVAKVRFYIESMDDIKFYVVHRVVDRQGKARYVNCLRRYDDPIDDCPICVDALRNKDYRIQIKMFLPVLDLSDNQVKLFERGKSFLKELEGVIRRNSPLVNYPCEIERNGEKGSTDTTYKVYPLAQEKDNTLIKDLPELPDFLGSYVLDLTFEQMQEFVKTGTLPGTNSQKSANDENLPRRTSSNADTESQTRRASRF